MKMEDEKMKMIKNIIKKVLFWVVFVVVLCGIGFFAIKHFLPNVFNDTLSIKSKPLVVENIKELSEFSTMTYCGEFLKIYQKDGRFIGIKDQIVLDVKGTVRAGFDMKKVSDDDVYVCNDTLKITLPPAEVFDVTVNPSGIVVFDEKGKWSHKKMKEVKKLAAASFEKTALENDILQKASDNGISQLTAMFRTMGFNEVVLTIEE